MNSSLSYDLCSHLNDLPTQAGVYQYFDEAGNLLYVGKAKNLKKRIKSYFRMTQQKPIPKPNLSPRIMLMISQVARIHTLLTSSEQDALILENSLIKSLKPKYNILLRDDKTYPYIYVDESVAFPRFEITRQILKGKQIRYFGPFVSGARELLDSLYECLPLVQKSSCIKGKNACVFHQIQKCKAPCEGKITQEEYSHIVRTAKAMIEDKRSILQLLESKMHTLSQNLHFEEAALIRDRIKKISSMKNQSIIQMASGDYDIFVLQSAPDMSFHILMKLFVRGGRVISSDYERVRQDIYTHNLPELYTQALLNHCKVQMPLPPSEILIPPFEFEDKEDLEILLREKIKGVRLHQPLRGKKSELLQLAFENAHEIMRLELQAQNQNNLHILHAIKELFSLQSIPYRIEVFDTSHHSGTHNVGGMIVFDNNDFKKDKYRRYELHASDEYGQMREMLTRRAQNFEQESPPDLWLLDGGKAQIYLAREILQSIGANVEVIAIAKMKLDSKAYRSKGAAHDILRSQNAEFKLNPSDKRLQFLQKLRDEVHQYAITYHRNKKHQSITKTQIIENIHYTQAQIKRLLDYFGSMKAIKQASTQEIQSVLKQRQPKQTKDSPHPVRKK